MISEAPQKFGVTLTAKLRHAALWEAAKKCGSQAALARKLNVKPAELGSWVNLQRVPSRKCGQRIEKLLFDLTGQTLDELFPAELRENAKFLAGTKSLEVTRSIETKMLGYQPAERLLLPGADVEAIENLDREEFHKRLATVLNTLDKRERDIIKLRFGLDGGDIYTSKEVGRIFNLEAESIRKIESKALSKMREPYRGSLLKGFLENADNDEPREIPITAEDWNEYKNVLASRIRRTTCVEVISDSGDNGREPRP